MKINFKTLKLSIWIQTFIPRKFLLNKLLPFYPESYIVIVIDGNQWKLLEEYKSCPIFIVFIIFPLKYVPWINISSSVYCNIVYLFRLERDLNFHRRRQHRFCFVSAERDCVTFLSRIRWENLILLMISRQNCEWFSCKMHSQSSGDWRLKI